MKKITENIRRPLLQMISKLILFIQNQFGRARKYIGLGMENNMDDMMDDIICEFLVESHENLDQLENDLVELEKKPTDRELLDNIFRAIHNIKGTSGVLGLGKLESITHVGENLLSQMRDGLIILDLEITSILLEMVDSLRKILSLIETTSEEGDVDYSPLIDRISECQQEKSAGKSSNLEDCEEEPRQTETSDEEQAQISDEGQTETSHEEQAQTSDEEQSKQAETFHEEEPRQPQTFYEEETKQPQNKSQKTQEKSVFEISTSNSPVISNKSENATEIRTQGQGLTDSSIRVKVEALDNLMNLVGELVLVRNQILQFVSSYDESNFISASQRLNLITMELQEGVMKTRMQPIGNVWSKYPRVVRDLESTCGKKVCLQMEGKDTELDRTLLEPIKDPLTHIVRNCVDHGIETPQTRIANGKNEEGLLLLRAFHEGGQVNIEISDDGGGINAQRLKQKALEKGLITPEQAVQMNERELINLIFLPGFSTAEKVTNVSGRGVGMDVVRANIEKIGGNIDLQSKLGEGN